MRYSRVRCHRRLGAPLVIVAVIGAMTAVVVPPASAAVGDISTFAGSLGEGLATRVAQDSPGVAVRGRTLFVGANPPPGHGVGAVVRAVDLDTGQERVIAGMGEPGSGGDRGLATAANLTSVQDLAVGIAGDLFIADGAAGRVRRIDAAGKITTVAGGGVRRDDGIPATEAELPFTSHIAVDTAGDLYLSDAYNKVRRVDATGTIATFAGVGGSSAFSGDGGPARQARFLGAGDLAFDPAGNLHISDGPRVRRVDRSGIITTIAGGGTMGFGTSGVQATDVEISPRGLAFDADGSLLIADSRWLRKVDAVGVITTVAGNGEFVVGPNGKEVEPGDGRQALTVALAPSSVVADSGGNAFVTEWGRARVRQIGPSQIITTVAGNGFRTLGGDGGPARQAQLFRPNGVAFDRTGNSYIADTSNGRVRKVSPSGVISSLSHDFPSVRHVAVDDAGRLFVASEAIVWRVDTDGVVTKVAGGGSFINGTGGRALETALFVAGLAVDRAGDLYIADFVRIRKVDAGGAIRTVAGGGTIDPTDGVAATSAILAPLGVQVDGAGTIFLSDVRAQKIWKVGATGLLTKVAGSTRGFSGDGGPATDAQLSIGLEGLQRFAGLALDGAGQLFIVDFDNNRVRRVDLAGVITTVAGDGQSYESNTRPPAPGEDVAATSTPVFAMGIGVDRATNLYLADVYHHRIRKVAGVALTPPPTMGGGSYHPLVPARILDTRYGTGGYASPVGPAATAAIQVTGVGGVPAIGVSAVALNVTVTQPTAAGYLTVFPTGSTRPLASNLNFVPAQTVPNLVVAKVGSNGKVSIYNSGGATHVVFDVVGWYAEANGPDGARYNAVEPARVVDTRTGAGGFNAPVAAGSSISPTVAGVGGVPAAGVTAVVLNVTATQPSAAGFLTVYPSGASRPHASNLNFLPSQTVPNLVVAKVGPDGKVSIYNQAGTTHVIFDVVGWFGATGASFGAVFNALVPARILDSRYGTGELSVPVGHSATASVAVAGRGGVPPTGVSAVVLNVTATQPTTTAYLTVFPSGTISPLASNLNVVAGQTVPNLVMAKVGSDGKVSVYNSAGSTHVVFDVVGWYAG